MASSRVHPQQRAEHTLAPIPLASTTSVSAPNATVLLFYSPAAAEALTPKALQTSLSAVLSAYPQLCGRLRVARGSDPGPAYTKRYHRTWMEYGREDDPGMLLEIEERDVPMRSVLPTPLEGDKGVSDFEHTNDSSLAPKLASPVTTPERDDVGPDPIAGVKITRFADGGAALVFASFHTLFDAGALGQVLADWVAVHSALARGQVPLVPERTFDPADLDARASGVLDADDEDPALSALEAHLDVFRYDSWARDPSGLRNPPKEMEDALQCPPELQARDVARGQRRGETPPWHTLSSEGVQQYLLSFTAAEIERIHGQQEGVSHQDTFVAHLWAAIARARGQTGEEVLDFAMACDARPRFEPPLPAEAPGCFNVCLGFQARAEQVADEAWAARRMRQAIRTVTAPVLGAWLHRRAHDLAPEREMICFPGRTSVVSTNWARSALYGLDWGCGAPILALNLVSAFGGYYTIHRQCGPGGGRWYEPGVVVQLWLEHGAMGRLLSDPQLRP